MTKMLRAKAEEAVWVVFSFLHTWEHLWYWHNSFETLQGFSRAHCHPSAISNMVVCKMGKTFAQIVVRHPTSHVTPKKQQRQAPYRKGFGGITFVNFQNSVKNIFILLISLCRWRRFCAETQEYHFLITRENMNPDFLLWWCIIFPVMHIKLTEPI